MYGDLSAQGLEIMGFPCNQFGAQEPWSEDKVLEFVQSKFNVSFPMFSKIEVNGPNTHEFYRYLKNNEVYKSQNLPICKEGKVENIPWNFAKFLVNKEGKVTGYYGPKVHPDEIRPHIE